MLRTHLRVIDVELKDFNVICGMETSVLASTIKIILNTHLKWHWPKNPIIIFPQIFRLSWKKNSFGLALVRLIDWRKITTRR